MSKVYSNFSSSNYIQLGKTLELSTTDEWEFQFKLSTPTLGVDQTFFSFGTSNHKGMLCAIWSSDKFLFTLSTSGSGWTIDTKPNYIISANTIYWIKYSRKLNSDDSKYYYYLDVSTDGITYNNIYTYQNNNQIYTSGQPIFIGTRGSSTSQYFRGKIYECKIYVNGNKWFDLQEASTEGYYNTGCEVSSEPCWSNFNDDNYIHLNNDIPSFTNLSIISKAKCSSVGDNNALISLNYDRECDIGVRNNHIASMYLDGWIQGNTSMNDNECYWWQIVYDNNEFKLYTLIDNNYTLSNLPSISNWNYECSISTDIFTSRKIIIGKDLYCSNEYWRGVIYELKVIIDNQEWFNLNTAVEGVDYTVVGSPLHIDKANIAYNFSSSNYIKLNPIKYNYNSKNAKAIIRAYYITNTSRGGDLLARSSDYDRSIYVTSDNRIHMYNGSNHFVGSLVSDNWYWFGYEWNGEHYSLYYMLDAGKYTSYKELPDFSHSDWSKSSSFDDTNDIFETGVTLGYNVPYRDSNRYWRGMIDLNNTIIGNNIISYTVGKEGYITKSEMKTISQDTTDSVTLQQGVKLTISPDQVDAKVVMWANGYKQTQGTNTLTAVEGIEVYYEVSKSGYATVSSSYVLTSSNHTINITMEEAHDWIQPQIYDYGTWGAEGTLSVKTDNGYHSDMYLWKAFNESNDAGWHSSGTGTPFSVYISLGQPVYVSKMSFVNRTNDSSSPWPARGGYLYGSNDGVNFSTIIATWTNDSALSAGQSWEFNVDNTQSWKYLKLYITDGSSYCCLKRIYITGEI